MVKGGLRLSGCFFGADYPRLYRNIAVGPLRAAILGTRRCAAYPCMAHGWLQVGRLDMAKAEKKIRRILHFRFTLAGANEQMVAMIKSAAPLYQMFGDAKVRLLQNCDDPNRFLQEIEYDAPEAMEINRQQIASDARVQAYLQAWRAMLPGAIEVDVFKSV